MIHVTDWIGLFICPFSELFLIICTISLSREPYLSGQLYLRYSEHHLTIFETNGYDIRMDTFRIEGNRYWVNSRLKADNYYAHIPIFANVLLRLHPMYIHAMLSGVTLLPEIGCCCPHPFNLIRQE
jgi:hypothetical protein